MKHGYYWMNWGLVALMLVCAVGSFTAHQSTWLTFFVQLFCAALLSVTTLICWKTGVK